MSDPDPMGTTYEVSAYRERQAGKQAYQSAMGDAMEYLDEEEDADE